MPRKNIGTFRGYVDENGERIVKFNSEDLDPRFDLFNYSRVGIDWGYAGSGSLQLSFAMLVQIVGETDAKTYRTQFSKEVVSNFDTQWEMSSKAVKKWVAQAKEEFNQDEHDMYTPSLPANNQINVVKKACNELNITQKRLAEILEVPEGTVSSWAVRNELPRLAKKAIEFYIQKQRNDKIVSQFRDLIALVS